MIHVSGIHDGALRLTSDAEVSGIVSGDVTVAAGCRVVISGMVEGDVRAAPGARVEVSGMVHGTVYGDGATIRVTGMAGG
ncbi:MAG: hypothetical protein DI544_01765 [Sphingomonas taxi]|uniref:Polymer-forming cytoskeletal protein n=1 Tax=Sphingomonas taxi TaxID=1549858 RepID=A0A2W5PAW8_9SPHN|nr:MAG: hypothetical protein DI544_01765 [Sphingomonas taxi]